MDTNSENLLVGVEKNGGCLLRWQGENDHFYEARQGSRNLKNCLDGLSLGGLDQDIVTIAL